MIVVSDTTPLRHLIAIGEVDLLRKLYEVVIVPGAVWSELHAESTPGAIKTFLDSAPPWLEVRFVRLPASDETMFDLLDPGEREAIHLAIELHAELLLMDDRAGRAVALNLSLPVTGTLGVLERSDILGFLPDLPATLASLEASGFYMTDRLRDTMLERHRRRRDRNTD